MKEQPRPRGDALARVWIKPKRSFDRRKELPILFRDELPLVPSLVDVDDDGFVR
jgi:hypothetical protein